MARWLQVGTKDVIDASGCKELGLLPLASIVSQKQALLWGLKQNHWQVIDQDIDDNM